MTYISWSSDFVLYLEDYLMDKCCAGDIDSMWHKHWTETACICRPVTYISWSSEFALYLADYLMDICHNWNIWSISWSSDSDISWRHFDGGMLNEDIDSVWHLVWPTTIYVGQWSIFLGTVILPYIFNTVWWTCLIPWILVLIWAICISWLSDFESFTCFCLLWYVEIWYENICECSKVKNRPGVYSRHEAGASMYFGHISSLFVFYFCSWLWPSANFSLHICKFYSSANLVMWTEIQIC